MIVEKDYGDCINRENDVNFNLNNMKVFQLLTYCINVSFCREIMNEIKVNKYVYYKIDFNLVICSSLFELNSCESIWRTKDNGNSLYIVNDYFKYEPQVNVHFIHKHLL